MATPTSSATSLASVTSGGTSATSGSTATGSAGASSGTASAAASTTGTLGTSQSQGAGGGANSSSSSSSIGDTAMSGTAVLPAPLSTTVMDSSLTITCPKDNRTVFEDPATGKEYVFICGRDYSSTSNLGAVDIKNFPSDTIAGCISSCASTPNCTAAGYGNFFGIETCWLKSHIGVPVWTSSWQIAVQVGQVAAPGASGATGLDTTARAGIAAGTALGVVGVASLAGALWWTRRQRRRLEERARRDEEAAEKAAAAEAEAMRERERLELAAAPVEKPHEMEGDMPPPPPAPDPSDLPDYPGSGGDPRYPSPSSATGGSNLPSPNTPPRDEKGGTGDWDWQGSQPPIQSADAELPGREGIRYGPEFELASRGASRAGGPRQPGPQWGPEAAEQKFRLQDLAFVKQKQKLNTAKAGPVSPEGDGEEEQGEEKDDDKKEKKGEDESNGGEGPSTRPPNEPPDDDDTGHDDMKGEGNDATDDKRSERYELP